MRPRLVITGFVIWLAATIALRLFGQHILHPGNVKGTLFLFALSFPLMAVLIRRMCLGAHLQHEQWLSAAVSLLLPTLLLDSFSSAFFPTVFPNIASEMAGVFGGWMLWCCAGGLVGAAVGKLKPVDKP
jgi:hypothetical protein